MELNPEQLQAIETTEGAVRVAAGAGTGKTRALTYRYLHLVQNLGISPKNILCVTFSNRAAQEMRQRLRKEAGNLDLGMICTFHAFCVSLLKQEIHRINFPKNFIILDVEDQRKIMHRVFEELKLTMRDATIQRALDEIIEPKKFETTSYIDAFFLLDNEELLSRCSEEFPRNERIFWRYVYEQKMCYGLDFNDLINFGVFFLEHYPEVRDSWQKRMEYVLVDEFQDVSARQYKLAQLLAGYHGNLFIVGDPDQTIYTWRGSHLKLFLEFPKDYPGCTTIALSRNYRSTPQILAAANQVISCNVTRFPKELHAQQPAGEKPLYFHGKSDKEEAQWIVQQINALAADSTSQEPTRPYSYSDVAILYRNHYLSRQVEEQLIAAGIPYRLYSGVEFYSRAEIKDVLCYMRMVTNGDDLAFLRTIDNPSRRIGKKKLERLTQISQERGCTLFQALEQDYTDPIWRRTGAADYVGAIHRVRSLLQLRRPPSIDQLLQRLLDLTGYEAAMRVEGNQMRLDNLAELKRAVADAVKEDSEATMEDFLQQAALLSNSDRSHSRDSVKLMTIHTAKGLEFPCVFICGLSEGVFPSRKITTPEQLDEERRLAYVAMTRACKRLFLSDSEGKDNANQLKYPSRFIFEATEEHLDYVQPLPEELKKVALNYIRSDQQRLQAISKLFSPGQRVRHPHFGEGEILRAVLSDAYYEIKFDKLPTPRMISFGIALEALEAPQ